MREKYRGPSERNNGEQWTVVSRRRQRPKQTQAAKTCFINHIPITTTISDLAQIFRKHGAIENIAIPINQKNLNHKFAFVQFYHPQSIITAIQDENGQRIGGLRMTVHHAKYDKPQATTNQQKNLTQSNHCKHQKPHQTKPKEPLSNVRDNRSYREVTNPRPHSDQNDKPKPLQNQTFTKQQNFDPSKPKQATFPFDDSIPPPNLTKPNPSRHRIMSSRVLGENTERIRNSLTEIEVQGDLAAALPGKKSEDNNETLARSVIAIASSSLSAETILDHILAEGVNCLTIKSMGGMQHLITFHTIEEKELMIESKWLERWYMELRNVNKHSGALWRETWINIYGVPLIGWCYENFFDIGSILGKVISVNYKNLDCANVLIVTDCLFDVNTKISMGIDGVDYPIYISEKQQHCRQSSCSCKSSQQVSPKGKQTSQLTASPSKSNHVVNQLVEAEKTKSLYSNELHMINSDNKVENCAHYYLEPPPSFDSQNVTPKKVKNPTSNIVSQCNTPQSNLKSPEKTNHNKTKIAFSDKPTQSLKNTLAHKSHLTTKHANHHKMISLNPNSQSPKISNPKTPLSPVQTFNKFGPLLRPNKTKSTSSSISTMGSSSSSGPLFPPGFEDTIPVETKLEKEEKRKKKLEKKLKLKQSALNGNNCPPPFLPSHGTNNMIRVEDVINMANTLGLSFDGPTSELRSRIERILCNQKQNWENNLS